MKINEVTAHLSTNPDNYGTTINSWSEKERHKVKDIPMSKLITFEHPNKMKDPTSKQNMMKIAKAYSMGEKIPPIMVKKHDNMYMVLDGHHRFFAAKLAGLRTIPAIIIPDDKITID
jgi:ParB-like chromosome segregation protein Spo0J